MKKLSFAVALLLVFSFIVPLILTGCTAAPGVQKQERPMAVSVVIGNHGNSQALNLASGKLVEAVYQAVSSYGYLSIIRVDGKPEVVLEGSCDIDGRFKGAAREKLEQDNEVRTDEILSRIQNVKAEIPEVDTLAALRLAVRTLSAAPEDADKLVYVVDTGVDTIGLCDFSNNLLCGDPDVIAETLYEKRAIPDFTNTTVQWQQMGDVALPQESLSPRQVDQLGAIWKAIVEKGGGSFQLVQTPPMSGEPDDELPKVTVVSLAAEAPIFFEPELAEAEKPLFADPIVFTESQFRFEPDSDALLDRPAAERVLRPIAEYMEIHPELELLLAGTTAGDEDSEFDRSLSLRRAMTVKDILVSCGIAEERVAVCGLGSSDPWHIYNVGTQGELAAQNRKVVLMDASSIIAREIMGCCQ